MTLPLLDVTGLGAHFHTYGLPDQVAVIEGSGDADFDLLNSGHGPIVVVSDALSAGYQTEERLLELRAFQVRTVGDQRQPETAKAYAWTVDRSLMMIGGEHAPTVVIGGVSVSSVARVGSGPTLLTRDPAGRSHYTASYLIPVPSGL